MAREAHQHEPAREALFATLFHDNARNAAVAAWALTHLPAQDNDAIGAHRQELIALATTTPDIPVRRLTLALLARLQWQPEQVDTNLLDFCLEHMMLADEPYGVRSLCMKLAYSLCRHYPELCEELRQSLLLIEPLTLGAGVRHSRDKILRQLQAC